LPCEDYAGSREKIKMKIYGLVGNSGTGKSYQSLNLCREMGIPCLIDDGLFIGQNRIYAGKSAKRAGTMLGAVKTAIFTEDEHRDEVVKAIRELNPESIMILGTSDRMIYRIADRLDLPEPDQLIHIEDIAQSEDIEEARRQRMEGGKHAIPVATFQLKREFSGYFLRPLKILRRVGHRSTVVAEKSEVRPTFSYLGHYAISERAIYDIIEAIAIKNPIVARVTDSYIDRKDSSMALEVGVILSYGGNVFSAAEEVQKEIKKVVEELTGFNIIRVDLCVKGLE